MLWETPDAVALSISASNYTVFRMDQNKSKCKLWFTCRNFHLNANWRRMKHGTLFWILSLRHPEFLKKRPTSNLSASTTDVISLEFASLHKCSIRDEIFRLTDALSSHVRQTFFNVYIRRACIVVHTLWDGFSSTALTGSRRSVPRLRKSVGRGRTSKRYITSVRIDAVLRRVALCYVLLVLWFAAGKTATVLILATKGTDIANVQHIYLFQLFALRSFLPELLQIHEFLLGIVMNRNFFRKLWHYCVICFIFRWQN